MYCIYSLTTTTTLAANCAAKLIGGGANALNNLLSKTSKTNTCAGYICCRSPRLCL